jgi:hypothetical protein
MKAVTGPIHRGRLLGFSRTGEWPVNCTWAATANNPRLNGEAAGRVARIRLDAGVEFPGQRTGFRHPDLLAWVQAHRAELVAAVLTIGRAWIVAGRPPWTETRLGGFEAWGEVIGGVLRHAGVAGFLGNVLEVAESAEVDEVENVRPFLARWWAERGESSVKPRDLLAIARETEIGLEGKSDVADVTALGMILSRLRDKTFDLGAEVGLVKVTRRAKSRVYSLVRVPAATPGATSATSATQPPSSLLGTRTDVRTCDVYGHADSPRKERSKVAEVTEVATPPEPERAEFVDDAREDDDDAPF